MKKMNILKNMAMSATLLLSLVSCSSEDAGNMSSLKLSKVPLQLSVENDVASRGVVDGTTLPDNSTYNIYVYSKNEATKYEALNNANYGSTVLYKDGISQIDDNPIYLPEDGSDVQVVALYGGISGNYANLRVNKIELSTKKQEDYLVGVNTNTVNKFYPKASLAFTHVMSRITLNIKKAEDNSNAYKIPSVTLNNVIGEAVLEVEGGSPYLSWIGDVTTSISVQPTDYELYNSSDVVTVDFLVLPTEQQEITVKVQLDGIEQEIKLPTTYFQMGQQYTYNVVIGKKNAEISEVDGHEYVDLGLPSGTKWATHNLDMSQPNKETISVEACGSYCNWADPTGEDIYKLEDVLPSAVPPTSICNTDYDIAHVQWGKEWRLPTHLEEYELRTKCTWEFIEINGINCGKAIGPNGNYIILPMGGEHNYGAGVYNYNKEGYYWTGDSYKVTSDDHYSAYYSPINQSYVGVGKGFYSIKKRNTRCLIRPVTK